MNIDPGTKVGELLDKYPQITEYIPKVAPQAKSAIDMLKNPLAKMMVKNATIHDLCGKANLDENTIVEKIKEFISEIESKAQK